MDLYIRSSRPELATTDDMAKWDPDSDRLPNFNELPNITGAPDHAAWFWGTDDEVILKTFANIHVEMFQSFVFQEVSNPDK